MRTPPDPPGASLALIRASQDRQLEREGIPMFLALVDDRPGAELASLPSEDGQAVAAELARLRAEVAGRQRAEDMGVLITLLQAAAFSDVHNAGAGSERSGGCSRDDAQP